MRAFVVALALAVVLAISSGFVEYVLLRTDLLLEILTRMQSAASEAVRTRSLPEPDAPGVLRLTAVAVLLRAAWSARRLRDDDYPPRRSLRRN